MELEVRYLRPDDLFENARNARTHSANQISQICSSILEFGFTNPILISDQNKVIAGHGRLMAAKKLELEKVPVIYLSDLSEDQQRLLMLADNKIASNSSWDLEKLSIEVASLADKAEFPMTNLGFSEDELRELIKVPEINNPLEGIDDDELESGGDKLEMSDSDLIGDTERIILIYQRAEFEEFSDHATRVMDYYGGKSLSESVLLLMKEFAGEVSSYEDNNKEEEKHK